MSARETANLCRVGSCKPRTMTAELVLPNGWRCASSSAPTRSPRPVGIARNFKRRTLAPQHKPLRHLRQVGIWVRQRSKADGRVHHCGLPKGHLIDLRRQRELYSLQDHGLR